MQNKQVAIVIRIQVSEPPSVAMHSEKSHKIIIPNDIFSQLIRSHFFLISLKRPASW